MDDLDRKILEAMHRIEELYNETEGKCYVSFSGGKDSTVLLALIKMCSEIYTLPPEGIKAVYCNTGIELGVTVDFVKWCRENYYPNIEIIRPEKSFDWILNNKGKPVKSKVRSDFLRMWQRGKRDGISIQQLVAGITKDGKNASISKLADHDIHMLSDDFGIKISNECCKYLKKNPFRKYEKENEIKGTLTGLRMGEGGARFSNIQRRLMNGGKICTYNKGKVIYKAPVVDWSDNVLEEFIEKYHVPLSKAYTEFGFERTGCMGCPYNPQVWKNLKYLHDHEPNRYKASMHWLKDVYIAQNVILPFDEAYERERERMGIEI